MGARAGLVGALCVSGARPRDGAPIDSLYEEAAEGDEDFDSGDEDDDDDKVDDLPAKNPFPLLLPDVIAIPDSGFVGFDDDDDDELESEAEEEGGKTEG